MRLLTVPGYTGSGPNHWQTLWEKNGGNISRVIQSDWDRPSCQEWVEELDRTVTATDTPTILIAHSLGCATVAHWSARNENAGAVVGAMMVAPADVDADGWPSEVVGFSPMPLSRFQVKSTVVGSEDDPWVDLDRARHMAQRWGSRFVNIGKRGHINSDSSLGTWPDGWRILEELVGRCGLDPTTFEKPTGADHSA